MAQYTIELKDVIKNGRLFDFDYPIFDMCHREILEQKIIDYYYYDEISMVMEGRWRQRLKSFMQLRMPYFNELYKATLIKYDPLLTTYLNEEVTNDKDTVGKHDAVSTGKSQGNQKVGEAYQTDTTTESDHKQESSGKSDTTTEGTSGKTTDEKTEGNVNKTLSGKKDSTTGVTGSERVNETKKIDEKGDNTFLDTPQSQLYGSTDYYATNKGNYTKGIDEEGTRNTNITNDTTYGETTSGTDNTASDGTILTVEDGTTNTVTNGTTEQTTNNNGTEKTTGQDFTSVDTNTQSTNENVNKTRNVYSEHYGIERAIKGRQGTDPNVLMQNYRNSIIDVDTQVIRAMRYLFMEVY